MPSSTPDAIRVAHAREHNLKDVSCAIPHGKLCVVTGPSGSGKSSLAFDVVFAEGQRRFMETLTPYARQFLPTLPRPDVDSVHGVPPAIALEQRTSRGGANSTVATVTEVAHYLRLLYAKVGELHCPECDAVVAPMSPDALFETFAGSGESANKTVYAPAVRARKGTYLDLFTAAARRGVQAARVDGAIVAIDPPPKLAKAKEHTIDLIVHYGRVSSLDRVSFDRALSWGGGALRVADGPPKANGRRADALDGARLPGLRHGRAGARSALVLVQHQAGAVRGVRGHRRRRRGCCGPRRRTERALPGRVEGRASAPSRAVCASTARPTRTRRLARYRARSSARASGGSKGDDGEIAKAPLRRAPAAPRVRRAGGPRLSRPRPLRRRPLGRRDAAPAPQRAARQRPDRRALRARRADHRPPPARHATPPRQPARSSPTWARRSSSSSTTPRRSGPPTT